MENQVTPHKENQVTITKSALEIVTHEQIQAMKGLVANNHNIGIFKASIFDLPEGYLTFSSHHVPSGSMVYGGIAPDGRVST